MRDHQAQIGYNDVQFYVEDGQSWDTLYDYANVKVVLSIDGDISWHECSDLLSLEEFDEKFKIACPSPNNR